MHRAGHPRMYEAHELVVARRREAYRIGLPDRQWSRGDARGPIEARSIGCSARTPHKGARIAVREKRWAYLADLQKSHRMYLISSSGPVDAIANVNPKLIREKGQSLFAFVSTLRAHCRSPRIGLTRLCHSKCQDCRRREWRPCFRYGVPSVHHVFFLLVLLPLPGNSPLAPGRELRMSCCS